MVEIIFFAILAGIVLYKLRSILGEEYDDNDQQQKSSSIKDVAGIIGMTNELQVNSFDINQSILLHAGSISEDAKIVVRKIHTEYRKSSSDFDIAIFKSIVKKIFIAVNNVYNNFEVSGIKSICSDDVYSKINKIVENFKSSDKRYNFELLSEPNILIRDIFEDRLSYKIVCEIRFTQCSNFSSISDDSIINGTEINEAEVLQELTFSRMINSSTKSWILESVNIIQ